MMPFGDWLVSKEGNSPLKTIKLSLSDLSYPINLQGWRITLLSPQGPPLNIKATKNSFWVNRFFVSKEGHSSLKAIRF